MGYGRNERYGNGRNERRGGFAAQNGRGNADRGGFGGGRPRGQEFDGVFHASGRGFGFLSPDEEGAEDLFVPAKFTMDAWEGDAVKYVLRDPNPRFAKDGSKKEAQVVEIVGRGAKEIVGEVGQVKDDRTGETKFFGLTPDNARYPGIRFANGESAGLKAGDKVKVEIVDYGNRFRDPEAKVVKVLGHEGDVGLDVLSIAEAAGISNEFPAEVLAEMRALPKEVLPEETKGRKDFRGLYTCTIDGPSTKDFDDALSVEKTKTGYRLWVHIADVAHYVKEGSATDKESLRRGTSTYFPGRTNPELPVEMSNGICSLNPKVDRLSMTAVMDYDHNGKRTGAELFEGVINSNDRMLYGDVTEILENPDSELREKYAKGLPTFLTLNELYGKLQARRDARGMIAFTLPEPVIKLNARGKAIDVEPHFQDLAMKIVEQCMLEANEAVAEIFAKAKIPFVYRIHENPDPERVAKATEALAEMGFNLPASKNGVRPRDVAAVVDDASGTEWESGVSMIVVRSMAQAKYSAECKGHFGLAATYYSHFTSPIRRYPDQQIHRIIHEWLEGKLTDERKAHYAEILPGVCEQASKTEKNSASAERDAVKTKLVEWMSGHVGEEFDAVISGVTNKGVFAQLANTAEGFIPLSALGEGYESDGNGWSVTNPMNGKRVIMGEPVKVVVKAADPKTRKADFLMAAPKSAMSA